MKVSVIGLGYVGLSLALITSLKGYEVIGIDKKEEIIEKISKGISHIEDDYVKELLKKTNKY